MSDERERLADERERVADERERLADERDSLADRHEWTLDQRAERWHADAAEPLDADAERVEAEAALRRARDAVERAQARLRRAEQALRRLDERAALRAAERERAQAGAVAEETTDPDERAWLAERRDFVAADRDERALTRGQAADARDEEADERERAADRRERDALSREREQHRSWPGGAKSMVSADGYDLLGVDDRAAAGRQRKAAAAARRDAAASRAPAAARWGPEMYGPMLMTSFADLTKHLFMSEELVSALPRALEFTVGAVAGCTSAGVTLWADGHPVDTIGVGPAGELERAQASAAAGPAVEAMRVEHAVLVPRVGDPRRWPSFEAAAARLGVNSALCHGLFVRSEPSWTAVGVLSLYGEEAGAFGAEDREFTSVMAGYLSAAVAFAQRRDEVERREAALHRGLTSRDIIGQAKGILMERQRLSAGEAFDALRRVSQRLNRRLTEVAEHLARTGELPE